MIHPQEIEFESKTEAGLVHTVIAPTILSDAICTCRGWNFREKCSHIDVVQENLCDYVAGASTEFTRTIIECPNCGAPMEDYELDAQYT